MVLVAILVAVVVAIGALAGYVARRSRRGDPADVRLGSATVQEQVAGHPPLRRLLQRRLDPAEATGLALTIAAVLAIGGTIVVGSVFEMVQRNDGLARLDSSAARFGSRHLSGATEHLFKLITMLGSTWVIIAVAVVVALAEWRRLPTRQVFFFLLVAIGGNSVITNIVKVAVDRARPDVARLVSASGPSFPSGHSSSAAVTYAALALVLGRGHRRRVKALLASGAAMITAAVATSRVLLGVHWLTDVIAGVALGWGWFAVSSIMFGGRVLHFGRPVEQAQADAAATPAERSRAGS